MLGTFTRTINLYGLEVIPVMYQYIEGRPVDRLIYVHATWSGKLFAKLVRWANEKAMFQAPRDARFWGIADGSTIPWYCLTYWLLRPDAIAQRLGNSIDREVLYD